MLEGWKNWWRPRRRRIKRSLGIGRYGTRGVASRSAALERDVARMLVREGTGLAAGEAPGGRRFEDHELRLYSQHGEDGLLWRIFSCVGATDRRLVEFGIEDGRECLARLWLEHFGWRGLLMEADETNAAEARRFYGTRPGIDVGAVTVRHALVTAENVDELFSHADIVGDFDLLSVDIDGNDYWVWKALTVASARVVAIEYNASFGPDEALVVAYDPVFDRKARHPSGWYHGASLAALAALGAERGLALVGCDSSGVNAFFVRRDALSPSLAEQSVREAWRPHRSRSAKASAAEQLALLRTLPLVRV